MRIDDDDNEYVCENCGCIYDIQRLKFIKTEKDNFIKDEYDILLEDVFTETDKKTIEHKMNNSILYMCPICKLEVSMFDRRKYYRN